MAASIGVKVRHYLKRLIRPVVGFFCGYHPRPIKVLLGPLRGKVVYLNPLHAPRMVLGVDEWGLCKAVAKLLTPGQKTYDIGAHVGYLTMLMSGIVGPGGHVASFELSTQICEVLRRTVSLNGADNVSVHSVGVYSRRECVPVAFNEHYFMASVSNTQATGQTEYCWVTDLDSYVSERNLPAPEFVKVDVEGAEVEALRGMRRLIQTTRPLLAVEFHSSQTFREGWQLLFSMGYSLYNLRGKRVQVPDKSILRTFPKSYLAADLSCDLHCQMLHRLTGKGLQVAATPRSTRAFAIAMR